MRGVGNKVLAPVVFAVVARLRNPRRSWRESADMAQALVKALNAGGIRRERALRACGR